MTAYLLMLEDVTVTGDVEVGVVVGGRDGPTVEVDATEDDCPVVGSNVVIAEPRLSPGANGA
jgi:hypothetical protein